MRPSSPLGRETSDRRRNRPSGYGGGELDQPLAASGGGGQPGLREARVYLAHRRYFTPGAAGKRVSGRSVRAASASMISRGTVLKSNMPK
jgi:hypothetical protein